jgi:hypothetical protein
MATKTDLITAINTQLTAIITQAKVRLASLAIVNELFPTEYRELHEQGIPDELEITTPGLSNLFYDISFVKRGNTVYLNGYVRNKTGAIFSGKVLNIDTTEYNTKTDRQYFASCSNGTNLEIQNSDILITEIANNEQAYFSLTYQTND